MYHKVVNNNQIIPQLSSIIDTLNPTNYFPISDKVNRTSFNKTTD